MNHLTNESPQRIDHFNVNQSNLDTLFKYVNQIHFEIQWKSVNQ